MTGVARAAPRRTRTKIVSAGPFDLALSVKAAESFLPQGAAGNAELIAVLRAERRPVLAAFRQVSMRPATVEVSSAAATDRTELRAAAASYLSADLDLRPFYGRAARHPILGPLIRSLRGLKPLRPASLFEMAVVAITEQQISLAATYHIRQRLVERFGRKIATLWAFPAPEALAEASPRALLACGLSRRKAEYILDLSRQVACGALDLDTLRAMTDDAARAFICGWRGFGAWSADYILARDLGRLDCVPVDDLGVRDAVGRYLGKGRRVSAKTAARLLQPFAPYRGLAVFYLLVTHRRAGAP